MKWVSCIKSLISVKDTFTGGRVTKCAFKPSVFEGGRSWSLYNRTKLTLCESFKAKNNKLHNSYSLEETFKVKKTDLPRKQTLPG